MVDRNKTLGFRFRHVKGPLFARQLGQCLIVEVVDENHCPYDCVYCPLGPTRNKSMTPREFAAIDQIKEEVKRKLHFKQQLDFVVLTGQGEPTLHQGLTNIAAWFEAHVHSRIALVTNGALLHAPHILHGVNRIDQVQLSFDAVDDETFQKIYRPHPEMRFDAHMRNLLVFRETFRHRLWLQVFLIRRVNLTPERLQKLARCIRQLCPDHVLLSIGPLPACPDYRNGISTEDRKALVRYISEATGVLTEFDDLHDGALLSPRQREAFALLERREFSLHMLAQNLSCTTAETRALLAPLLDAGAIHSRTVQNEPYYYLCHDWCRPSLKYQRIREEELPEIDFKL
ncbi:MAG: radical SAM protein [Candidatus Hydrogenedentes bacterium]|nr:radical SAM protein [Candidatus Hydrogenedentota bacterium]